MTTDPPPAPKHPGRPMVREPRSQQIGVRLSPHEYDALYSRAQRDRVSLSEVIRKAIRDQAS